MKEFDESLFNRFDGTARTVVGDFLSQRGFEVSDNPDVYGIDLVATSNGRTRMVEVEVKTGWTGVFPFNNLHIPARKAKFAADDAVFCVLSADLKRMAVVTGDHVLNSKIVEKLTRLTDGVDYFYEIPISKCYFYELKNPPVEGGTTGGKKLT